MTGGVREIFGVHGFRERPTSFVDPIPEYVAVHKNDNLRLAIYQITVRS